LNYIYVRDDDTKINSMKDLIGKKVAILKGFGTIQKINKKFPEIKIVETKNLSDSIQRVLNGEVDALYDGKIAVEYQMQEDLIVGLKGIPQKEFNAAPLHFFSHIDKPILRDILDKAIKDIPPYEINKIKSKWILENSKRKTLLETRPETEKLTLSDILPIKEIAFGLVIFLAVFYLIWKFQVKSTNKDMTLKSTLFVLIGFFLFFASAITILTLQNIEKSQKNEVEESLKTVVNSTYKTMKTWIDSKFRKMDIVLDDETLINQIIKLDENKELLPEIKNYFERHQKVFEDAKYYLVSNKLEVILSNIKDYKLSKFDIAAIKKMIDKSSLRKLTVFPSKAKGSMQENILFIKAVKDNVKKSISFLVIKIDPAKEFRQILQNGRMGNSGETYTFNDKLQLTSNSRFDKDLRELGLLEKGESSILNIDIRDRYLRPTYLAQKSLEKTSGISTVAYEDYRFVKVYGAWIWDDELEITFASEIDEDEAMGAFMNMKKTLIVIVFSIIAFTIFLAILIAWISTKSKKSLEKANDDLNKLLESFDENVIASRIDLKGNITYASKAFVEISGYSLRELLGSQHSIIRHPDTPKEIFKDLWKTITSGKVWKGELKNSRKDGSIYWVDVVITPKLEDDGNILSYSAIKQDITSKKEVEKLSESLEVKVEERTSELKESELRLHTLFDAAPDSIAIIKDGKYISCNKKTLDLFGYTTNESFCNSFLSDNSPVFQEGGVSSEFLAQKRINDALEKKYTQFEWKHKRNDTNKEFDAEVILAKITLGDEPHIYAVVRDISERKQLERLIKENQEQMTFVSQYANFGFWNFNPQIGDLHVNDIFVEMLGYDAKQVLENGHENQMFRPFKDGLAFWEQLLHPDDVKRTGEILSAHINGETELYKVEYRMKKSDGSWMWSLAMGRIAEYDLEDRPIRFNGVNIDIEDSKKAEFEIQQQKEFVSTLLDSQEQIVITTDGLKLRTANKAFLNFFDIENVQYFLDNHGDCICDTFEHDESSQYIQKMMGEEKWIDYVYNRPEIMHKVMMKKHGQNHIFTISSEKFVFDEEELETAVFTDITELEKIREEVEKIHKHTKDSIEYASLIQHALIPQRNLFQKYFNDYLTIWQPKDIVGGDIYLFEELRNENECLLMVIDCTGHGVPGAFVTMLVKAIERQITSNIINSDEVVSPAKILSIFNRNMKHLLKQNHEYSLSNAGFDGGIIYYNKAENIIKFAGAETPLFYFDANDKFKTIKGNRHSIGYKKSNIDYEFTEHIIKVKSGMKFYISTDGYFDQNGGEKGFPLGKSRFKKMIEHNYKETFEKQKEILTENLKIYQDDEERNDDITLIGFEINSKKEKITKLNVKDINWSV
ncbi:PAS domain S-box protein, partial [Sulfurospirillum sp.]|nr:PAS domain S-box protein [Sulfurospirillum sp.]